MASSRGGRASRKAAALLAAVAFALPWGCGARSALPVPTVEVQIPPTPASNAFCAKASYPSGFGGLSIYVLLDQSASMVNDGKWDSVTAALQAFAEDPLVAGIGMGLQYFPLGDECADTGYAVPAVPIKLLPGNAPAIKASLAAHGPKGDTPTLPALRGALEYAKAALIAAPTRDVIVVLATDGDPDTCDSTAGNVAAAAADGLSSQPQVVTAVIGIEHANATALNEIAAAGGAGQPIPIGSGPGAAQQFVNALRTIRDNAQTCRFVVPQPPGATVTAADVGVVYQAGPGAAPKTLVRLPDASACSKEGGFYLTDPAKPNAIELCPGNCQTAHSSAGSTIAVSAGCGAGSPPAGTPTGDGGMTCGSAVDFACVTACAPNVKVVNPICVGTLWECPAGTISTTVCNQCQPVPHGCCMPGGGLAEGSCIDGVWTCPPGGQLFGQGSCQPPAVCAATLPCPLTAFCQVADGSCGLATTTGTCQPLPTACAPGGPQACGCDGQVYPSTCAAQAAGVDVATNVACPVPQGTFSCGPLFCQLGTEICERLAFTQPNAYSCVPVAPGCPTGCEGSCQICPPCPVGKLCNPVCTSDSTTGGPILTCNEI